MIPTYEVQFWRVLEREKLADLSQYYAPGFFDEIPLYSRFADVSFLESLDLREGNKVLLSLSLDYLDRVIHFQDPETSFFAAITIREFGPRELIVPNLFAAQSPSIEHLERGLSLDEPTSCFSRELLGMLEELHLADHYSVLQDTLTVPDEVRAFVGHTRLGRRNIRGLDQFRKRVAVGDQRGRNSP